MPLTPEMATLLAGLAQGALGGIQSANQGKMSREQLAAQERQYASTLRQNQGQQALMASQMDPLVQQRSRQKSAFLEQLMKGMSSPTLNVGAGKFEGGMQWSPEKFAQISSFFTPEARQNAEAQFGLNATAASGGQYAMPNAYPGVGNMGGVGYPSPVAPAGGVTPTTPMPTPGGVQGGPPSFWDDQEERRKRRDTPGGMAF